MTIDDTAAEPGGVDGDGHDSAVPTGHSAEQDSSALAGRDSSTPTWEDSALTAEENAVLDLEETWWTRGRNKTEAIATIGMAPTRYYLLLNRILANPQARMERPELVGRLLRLRQRRAEERRMGNVPPGEAPAG
ncbi:MAG: DUF3263 domain-containing protein [Actinomycetaceae bacterium]|nr:DUF3263 domain-containing protein [Actinomycetaceae bacterium]